jgi:hypothetical protein
VADPAGREAYEDLARARLGEIELLYDEGLPEFLEYRRPDLHRQNLSPHVYFRQPDPALLYT